MADSLSRARAALERATRFRAAADEGHAQHRRRTGARVGRDGARPGGGRRRGGARRGRSPQSARGPGAPRANARSGRRGHRPPRAAARGDRDDRADARRRARGGRGPRRRPEGGASGEGWRGSRSRDPAAGTRAGGGPVTAPTWLGVALLVSGVSGTATLAGCGGPLRVASLDDMERARTTNAAQEGATGAPEVYAHAEGERVLAERSHAEGDDVSATLHAEHALAGYGHAVVVARKVRATAELADASRRRGRRDGSGADARGDPRADRSRRGGPRSQGRGAAGPPAPRPERARDARARGGAARGRPVAGRGGASPLRRRQAPRARGRRCRRRRGRRRRALRAPRPARSAGADRRRLPGARAVPVGLDGHTPAARRSARAVRYPPGRAVGDRRVGPRARRAGRLRDASRRVSRRQADRRGHRQAERPGPRRERPSRRSRCRSSSTTRRLPRPRTTTTRGAPTPSCRRSWPEARPTRAFTPNWPAPVRPSPTRRTPVSAPATSASRSSSWRL